MKRSVLTIISMLIFHFANAQWTTTGNDIKNSNIGNVGINLPANVSPQLPLTVGNGLSIVQKNVNNPYVVVRGFGGADLYLQGASAAGSDWTRTAISSKITWTDATNLWHVDGGLYSDFGTMNFENTGDIAFYNRGTTGNSYDITQAQLQSYKRMKIASNGVVSIASKLSIGTETPISKFQIGDGFVTFSSGSAEGPNLVYGTSYIGFNAARSGEYWSSRSDGANNGGGAVWANVLGDIYFAPIATTGNSLQYLSDATIKSKIAVEISRTGILRAKQIKVETSNWPDFVFGPRYKLRPLAQLGQYISKNHHLPGVPPSAQVEKEGLDVAAMNRTLLQKVEELTLYLLEKDKQMNDQNERVKKLELLVQKLMADKAENMATTNK